MWLAALLGFFAFVRYAPSNPEAWHVDPEPPAPRRKRNYHQILTRPFEMDRHDLLQAFHDVAIEHGAEILAGSLDAAHVTYIIRSELLKYPDYISVKIDAEPEESRLWIYSRSRYGQRDFGVNRRRVEAWVEALRKT